MAQVNVCGTSPQRHATVSFAFICWSSCIYTIITEKNDAATTDWTTFTDRRQSKRRKKWFLLFSMIAYFTLSAKWHANNDAIALNRQRNENELEPYAAAQRNANAILICSNVTNFSFLCVFFLCSSTVMTSHCRHFCAHAMFQPSTREWM